MRRLVATYIREATYRYDKGVQEDIEDVVVDRLHIRAEVCDDEEEVKRRVATFNLHALLAWQPYEYPPGCCA